VKLHDGKVDAASLPDLFAAYDVVLRLHRQFPFPAQNTLLADAPPLLFGKKLVQASIHRFEGQLLTIDPQSPGGLPALPMAGAAAGRHGRQLRPEVGVLGVTPGLFRGTLQASEALKIILGPARGLGTGTC